MIKFVTIIGARPQIIKAAAISRTIKNKFSKEITEIIVHTGQHYDQNMSEVFFQELDIPKPNYNLKVGSGKHGIQTADMIKGIEHVLEIEKPEYIILYGDTNSTLAGAIAASKINVPIVHIEAGLRSFNKNMPEEINRILCDQVSSLLFSPTKTGYINLLNEGFKENKMPFTFNNPGVFHCGDIMYDNSLYFADKADEKSTILKKLSLEDKPFILATIHRNQNTDDANRLKVIFDSLLKVVKENNIDIVLPIHPRTRKMLINLNKKSISEIENNNHIQIIEPIPFLDMISLEKRASLIITDSGGVQKEAYFFKKPCVILRPETEWVEVIESGVGVLADTNEEKILGSVKKLLNDQLSYPPIFGDGKAAEFICSAILRNNNSQQ
jgi:UDP-GlcNAc3NAcA epimerase